MKIVYKQTTCRVYRRTRKDEDYANYKEALNLATTEIKNLKESLKKIGRQYKILQQQFLRLCKE